MRWLALFFLLCPRAWGAITIVAAAHLGQGSTDTNTFTTTSINTTGCNFLVASVGYFSTIALTDSKGNSWTPLTAFTNGGGNNSVRIFYVANPVVGTGHTFTLTGASSFGAIAVQGFSGVNTVPFDQQNGATQSISANTQPGSVSPTQDNELIVTAYSQSLAGTMTINSGFTITDQTQIGSGAHFGSALAYIINGAGTSGVGVNPTWTNGTGVDQSAASIATFKVAAAAATTAFGAINNPLGGF